jgi:AsmA protein
LRVGLAAGVLNLKPLRFGFAGGEIVSTIVLDAGIKPMAAEAAIDLRRVQFARLFPTLDTKRVSTGELGAQIRLSGRGQSVASLLRSANGTVAAAMSGGRISHTVVAAASLDGGKLLPLLLRGDEPVAVRCAVISMAVEQGLARTQLFVVDAETARIDGQGAIDLGSERFALELDSKPKEPSILSVRAPLNVEGTFRDPRVAVSSGTLLRGGAALALAAVNPLAALIPLIETGPGEDADCARLLAPVDSAAKQARQASDRPPPVSKKSAAARR